MTRNIYLAYVLAALKNSWFWLGIWVFYYLKFTNYAGIGLIETVLIITYTTMEIPTGAIADLLGKRITLVFSFLFQGLGNFIMAFSPNIYFLMLSVFVGATGGTLYSGTMEALVYDSLKEKGKEEEYSKVLGNMMTFQYIMMAVTGTVGGFMYVFEPRLPFIASSIFYFLGFFIALFLNEPAVDTLKFSLTNFINQNKQGFIQLFRKDNIKRIAILLLIISSFAEISDEMLNDVLAVEFGFSAWQLGIFISSVSLIAAGVSQIAPRIIKHLDGVFGAALLGALIAITYFISPWAGIVLGGISLLLRVCLQTVYNNMQSVIINKITESKDRATTLSSFNMIKNLPYVLSAYFLGSLMDLFSARRFALVLGLLMLVLIIIQALQIKKQNNIFRQEIRI